jgi:hypothetical protein
MIPSVSTKDRYPHVLFSRKLPVGQVPVSCNEQSVRFAMEWMADPANHPIPLYMDSQNNGVFDLL